MRDWYPAYAFHIYEPRKWRFFEVGLPIEMEYAVQEFDVNAPIPPLVIGDTDLFVCAVDREASKYGKVGALRVNTGQFIPFWAMALNKTDDELLSEWRGIADPLNFTSPFWRRPDNAVAYLRKNLPPTMTTKTVVPPQTLHFIAAPGRAYDERRFRRVW